VLAAVTDGGVWVRRILRAPVHGLIVGYPVFSIQAFRFIRPALTSKEKNLAALILAVVPIIFGLLVFSVWPFEWGWFYLLGNHARFDFNMLASKALLVGFILWVLIDVRVRPQTIDNRVRTILRWVFWGSILIITSPAAVTAGILLVLQILLFVLAMRSLLSRDLDR
jgi:Sec-independent protein secretion pathway component TatC